jgi:hypothetical protein
LHAGRICPADGAAYGVQLAAQLALPMIRNSRSLTSNCAAYGVQLAAQLGPVLHIGWLCFIGGASCVWRGYTDTASWAAYGGQLYVGPAGCTWARLAVRGPGWLYSGELHAETHPLHTGGHMEISLYIRVYMRIYIYSCMRRRTRCIQAADGAGPASIYTRPRGYIQRPHI